MLILALNGQAWRFQLLCAAKKFVLTFPVYFFTVSPKFLQEQGSPLCRHTESSAMIIPKLAFISCKKLCSFQLHSEHDYENLAKKLMQSRAKSAELALKHLLCEALRLSA